MSAFEKSFVGATKPADAAAKQVPNAIGAAQSGQISIYDCYEVVKTARRLADATRNSLFDIEVPDGLPDDVSEHLRDAKSDAIAAYRLRRDGYDHALEFLDESKPSTLSAFREKAQQSQAMLISAAAKVAMAKVAVGLVDVKKAKK